LNLKEKVIRVPSLNAKPDDSHCCPIKLIIKPELLLLSTKKGSDIFRVAVLRDFELANKGINK
jgi:hypothetical protein